jgi:hypothetical protein
MPERMEHGQRSKSTIDLVLPGGQPFALHVTPSAPTTENQPLSAVGVLAPETLEHGAYYAGRLGATPAIARWHAKKRRFVFGEHTLGRQRVRAVSHIADGGKAEAFAPLSKTQPKDTYRVSDYAFETAG